MGSRRSVALATVLLLASISCMSTKDRGRSPALAEEGVGGTAGFVCGRVLFPEGLPAGEPVDVVVYCAEGDHEHGRAPVDADGGFELECAPIGLWPASIGLDSRHMILDERPRFQSGATFEDIELAPRLGAELEVQLELPDGIELSDRARGKLRLELVWSLPDWSHPNKAGPRARLGAKLDEGLRASFRGLEVTPEPPVPPAPPRGAPSEWSIRDQRQPAPDGPRVDGKVPWEYRLELEGLGLQRWTSSSFHLSPGTSRGMVIRLGLGAPEEVIGVVSPSGHLLDSSGGGE